MCWEVQTRKGTVDGGLQVRQRRGRKGIFLSVCLIFYCLCFPVPE